MKSSEETTSEIFGDALLIDSVEVSAGWNLIGSISVPVAVADLTSDPPGMVTGDFITFNGGYSAADSIRPGKGYWVKASGSGTLVLADAAPMMQRQGRIRIVPTPELPPPPPADAIVSENMNVFTLRPAYPNPFNPSTNFEFRISNFEFVSLKVYDVLGREVATLVDELKPAGEYMVTWDASEYTGGVYFCRMRLGGREITTKLVLMK